MSFKVPPACFMIPLTIEEGKGGMSEKMLNPKTVVSYSDIFFCVEES